MVGGGTAAWNVVAIEWYQTNGLASPHPWKARDSRKALRVCPPTAVNMHFTPPIDHRPRTTPALGTLWLSSGTRRTGQAQASASRRRIPQK